MTSLPVYDDLTTSLGTILNQIGNVHRKKMCFDFSVCLLIYKSKMSEYIVVGIKKNIVCKLAGNSLNMLTHREFFEFSLNTE